MNLLRLQAFALAPVEQTYDARDCMLYTLSLGYGSDPLDRAQLRFVYEEGLATVPSLCLVLARPPAWFREPSLEIDFTKIVYGEQRFELVRPLLVAGRVRARYETVAVEDKGPGKGAVLHQRKTLHDAATDEHLATAHNVLFLRGDGGCGAFGEPPTSLPAITGEPVRVLDLATLPQSALLYRLNGDYNPIHADPDAATRAGLGRPILHGLCTFGVAVRALVDLHGGDPVDVTAASARFVSPVYPGETIRTELHPGGRFRARVVERDVVVLDRGIVSVRPGG